MVIIMLNNKGFLCIEAIFFIQIITLCVLCLYGSIEGYYRIHQVDYESENELFES